MEYHSTETSKAHNKSASVVLTILLGFIFLLTIIRLINYAALFATKSLQVDFSAYYTAGESLNAGLSPYKNNVVHVPPIWDGIARYKYSRFLYPPSVASFFQPIALLPYFQAKILWELLTILFIIATLIITSRLFPLRDLQHVCLMGIFTAIFYPLLIHLERGQVDALTLLLITTAFGLMTREDEKNDFKAGIILSFAALFKLYSLFLLPFILTRKRWHSIKGFVLGSLGWIILTILVQGGWTHLVDYGYNHLPRIANLGDIAASDTLVDKKIIRAVLAATPPEFDTIKDGRGYLLGSLQFTSNATLIEPVQYWLEDRKILIPNSYLSMAMYACLFTLVCLWQHFFVRFPLAPREEYIYWQVPLMGVLLAAPFTWAMNVVWLLPLSILVSGSFKRTLPWIQILSLSLISFGLVLAMLPENLNSPVLTSISNYLASQKYVYAELIIFVGLFAWFIKPAIRSQSMDEVK